MPATVPTPASLAADQTTSDLEVPWGEHGIDALIWGEAEPEPANASGQPPAKASPPTTGLSSEDETWLGHA